MSRQSPQTGLLLPSREALLFADSDLTLVIDAARGAEQAGYDSVWVGDSLLARPRGEPLTLLAGVAGATTRVTLGTAVLLPLLRHPVSLAHVIATLDRIAKGRLVVGIGPGAELPGTHAELAALGVPSDRRVGAMLIGVERTRRLLRHEETGLELQPRPFRPGGPPFWLGGSGPRMLRLAGGTFDGWLPFSPTPADYASGLRAVHEAAEEAGRDPDSTETGAYLTVAVADTPAEGCRRAGCLHARVLRCAGRSDGESPGVPCGDSGIGCGVVRGVPRRRRPSPCGATRPSEPHRLQRHSQSAPSCSGWVEMRQPSAHIPKPMRDILVVRQS